MMHHRTAIAVAGAILLAGSAQAFAAEKDKGHAVVSPSDIEWGPPPPGLPPGAQVAAIQGNPEEDGPFTLRVKLPEGYVIPPHTHPSMEAITVISGTVRGGMGETVDREQAATLPEGSFVAFPAGMAHYAFTEGEAVIQVNMTGPWVIEYVNPEDDPRRK